MPTNHRAALKQIRSFPALISYLRDKMGWPIEGNDLEEVTFEYTAEELGIDPKSAAKIKKNGIKRLRPLSPDQPWGIFFIEFEPKRLPVVALRRILSQVVLKKRATGKAAERAAWAVDDLLFISNYGEGEARQITFAHFSQNAEKRDLPTLNVLGWDSLDTLLHLDGVAKELTENLAWPKDLSDLQSWRETWRRAFPLRHRETITKSRVLAVRLAELARAIRDRIKAVLEIETDKGPVTRLLRAFQEALIHDLSPAGFADMYAQTIAYGLLSARITDPKANTADGFAIQLPATNPFLKELMETFLHIGGRKGRVGRDIGIDFDELGVSEVVELLDDTNMDSLARDFGDLKPEEDPVTHFYELFLNEFDQETKKRRGVFYTPRPVVSCMVRSVHALLQTEFGLTDGLADLATWADVQDRNENVELPEGVRPSDWFVTVLDPATGTGTFLVEVVDVIHATLLAKWRQEGVSEEGINDLWNEYVPRHLLPRLYGYELLMAPYAIAHLKIGLKLYETGYKFASEGRVRIYLTNALEPAHDYSSAFEFAAPALAHEAQAVNEVKRNQPFTVVLGNPPYSSVSFNRIPWSDSQIERYKETVRTEETQIQVLSDDYVRFFALGEYQLRRVGAGVLCLISNNNWWSGRVFRDMRRAVLSNCDLACIVDLHGNSRLRETTPAGEQDDNVFDIVQGVGITMCCRRTGPPVMAEAVWRQDVWGKREEKYAWLVRHRLARGEGSQVDPTPPLYRFDNGAQGEMAQEYDGFASIPTLFGTGNFASDKTKLYGTGFKSQQDDFAVAFEKREISANVEELLASGMTERKLRTKFRLCTTSQWSFTRARSELRMEDWRGLITRCLYHPFDMRWTVFHRGVISNLRRETMLQLFVPGGVALCTMRGTRDRWENHALVANTIVGKDAVSPLDMCFVFPLTRVADETSLVERQGERRSNLNQALLKAWKVQLRSDGSASFQPTDFEALVVSYVYAILYCPKYQERYNQLLRRDFPRVPLTGSHGLFTKLARLGGELIDLHLMESSRLGELITSYSGPSRPEVHRVGWSNGTVWLDAGRTREAEPASGSIGFHGVREEVWNFQLGGYQVCERWLKDRKGRRLSHADIAHYQQIVVVLSETIRLMTEIDNLIERHGGWPMAFQAGPLDATAPLQKVAEERQYPYERSAGT